MSKEEQELQRRLVRQIIRAVHDDQRRLSDGAQSRLHDLVVGLPATREAAPVQVSQEAVGKAVDKLAGGLLDRARPDGKPERVVLRPRLIQQIMDYLLKDYPPD